MEFSAIKSENEIKNEIKNELENKIKSIFEF